MRIFYHFKIYNMASEKKIKEAITNVLKRAFTQDQIYDLTDLVFDSISPLIEIDDKCERCNTNMGVGDHLCPYKMEINDDKESKCNCCDICRQECSDSI